MHDRRRQARVGAPTVVADLRLRFRNHALDVEEAYTLAQPEPKMGLRPATIPERRLPGALAHHGRSVAYASGDRQAHEAAVLEVASFPDRCA